MIVWAKIYLFIFTLLHSQWNDFNSKIKLEWCRLVNIATACGTQVYHVMTCDMIISWLTRLINYQKLPSENWLFPAQGHSAVKRSLITLPLDEALLSGVISSCSCFTLFCNYFFLRSGQAPSLNFRGIFGTEAVWLNVKNDEAGIGKWREKHDNEG